MSTEYNKSDVIEKVKKLLALSKSSNQHEAELAAQRASDLMKKYQIDAAVVEATSIKSGKERVADVHFEVPDLRMKYQWVVTLGIAAAKLFDGTILVNGRLHGTGFVFVGFESEIPMMKEAFLHFYNAWKGFVDADLAAAKEKHLARMQERKDSPSPFWLPVLPWAPKDTMKFKHGHGQGYADALYRRCRDVADQRNAQVQAASNDCHALVLVRSGAITAHLAARGVKNVRLKQTAGARSGYQAGAAAGSRVALGGTLKG